MTDLPSPRDMLRVETCRRGAGGDRGQEQIPQRDPARRSPRTRSHPPATMLTNGHEAPVFGTAGIRGDSDDDTRRSDVRKAHLGKTQFKGRRGAGHRPLGWQGALTNNNPVQSTTFPRSLAATITPSTGKLTPYSHRS